MPITRPDGSEGKAAWVMLCQACFQLAQALQAFPVRGDFTWEGNEPCVEEPEVH
jgi:hypothetical protein